ncbi:MAG: hypothetical protein ABFC94_13545 [Syntrophomonas sp.]
MNTYVSYCRNQKSYITDNLICSNRDTRTGCTFCPNLTRFKNPANIDGFNKLDDGQKAIFSQFILNFFNGWGPDVRNSIEPIGVSPQYSQFLLYQI